MFGTFVENNKRFSKPLQELNLKAFNYYKMLEKRRILILKDGQRLMNYIKMKLFYII